MMKKNVVLFLYFFLGIIVFSQSQNSLIPHSLSSSKASPRLARLIKDIPLSKSDLYIVKGNEWAEIIAKIEDKASEIELLYKYPETNTAIIKTTARTATEMLSWPEVTFLDIRNQIPREELSVKNFDLSVNEVSFLHNQFPELDGEEMVVSVKENRYDSVDMDLVGRYLPSSWSTNPIHNHSTTMATMIAGAGNSFYTGKGIAPEAWHTSASFYRILPEPQSYFDEYWIGVQNHSYGVDVESYYGVEAEAYDQQIYQDGKIVHVFSAGNSGLDSAKEGRFAGIPGFANLTGNFKMAKNLLTVGSVDSLVRLESRSSRGPAHDGRVKPELVAYGADGSSGAAAITSGVSLLIQQAYLEKNDSLPPAELVKAALLNGAKDLLSPGPDFQSGYGNVQAYQSVRSIQEGNYLLGKVKQGEVFEIPLSIPSNVKNIKLTLCWLDPPAEPNASRALLNDLDVKLISPDSSQTWLPWTLNIFPDSDSLLLPAQRGRDTLNPQEQISIANPQEGSYSIEIRGQSVHTAEQRFALVYDWELKDEFSWTNPFEKGNMTSNRVNIIRWKTSFENAEGRIEYRLLNQGSGWYVLADKISLESEYHPWRVPDVFTPAQLRIIINNDTLNSDTFVISRPLEMTLQLDCEDSILVSWEKKDEISSYRLWTFADNQLTELIQTSDSFAVLPAFSTQERWMGVQPILNHDYEGLRGPLLNLDFLNGGCYVQSFFAREADNGIETNLKLGAWYGVEEVRIEKRNGGAFESLVAFPFPNQVEFDYSDLNPNRGANTYRAVVELNNGTTLYSDEQTVIYVPPATSLLYPNPSYEGDDIFIQTKNLEGSQFYLYDNMGRLVVILSIDVETEILFTDFLTRGIYHYHIMQEGERKAVGKLLVH